MCETKGFVPKLLVGRGQRKQAPQACQCAQPTALSSVQYAQRALVIVGVIVVLALMKYILIGGGVLLLAGGGCWLVRRVRALRQPVLVPAPLPAPARTAVTHVNG